MARELTEAEAKMLERQTATAARLDLRDQVPKPQTANPLATTPSPEQPGSLGQQLAKAAVPRARPTQRMRYLGSLERTLLEMQDDEERRWALACLCPLFGLTCERVDKRVPGTNIPEGAFPP